MSRRSSTRNTRSSKSKYFASNDADITDKEDNDKDSDYEPFFDDSEKVDTKTRKRKSADVNVNSNKKRSKATQNKGTRVKKGKNTPTKVAKLDLNNNETKNAATKSSNVLEDSDDDDNDDNWEEVEDAEVFDIDTYKPSLPNSLKITLEQPKKEKKDWLEAYIRQEINRIRKRTQLDAHKSHLLLLIGRLKYLNNLANDLTIKALIMSIIGDKFKSKENITKLVPKLLRWLNSEFKINIDNEQIDTDLYLSIKSSFEFKSITSPLVFGIIIIATLRALNFYTRLCYFMIPVPIKPSDLLNKKSKKSAPSSESQSRSSTPSLNLQQSEGQSSDSTFDWKCNYHWIEIFDETKKKWNCFDFVNDIQNDAFSIGSHLNKDISYILAIDNDGFISEVTQRYASDWVSYAMKKRRIEDDWWENSLMIVKRPEICKYEEADMKEFDELMSKVELPKRISDFKNHPMFVLQRDILKFQAIYPPNAPTLGFFRSEPVYARECLHTLKSRETWLRDARTVKPNEAAYKVVTSSFRTDKESGKKAMLEIFGFWQTVPYDPPEAIDGVVPRNAYGNVELFQDCMLPKGTVHLRLPGLARIAAKLDIDCVPAVVGFDCNKHSRGAHPVTDGFVVCSQSKQILMDAWNEEQVIILDRQKKKREKRAYDNWKRLIKGLIIRQNLKIKYG